MAKADTMEGLHHVRLILTDCGQTARYVFESQSFEQYGLERKGIRLDGQFYDQAFLLREL
jgi:hypothetical protein